MSDAAATKRRGPGANVRASDIVLDDRALSLAAKGVFVSIGLLGGSCLLDALDRHTSDGAEVVRAAVLELVASNYVALDGDRVTINDPLTYGLSE